MLLNSCSFVCEPMKYTHTRARAISKGPLTHGHPISPSDHLVTTCKRSCDKVMFLHLSVILFARGSCMAGGVCGKGVCVAKGRRGTCVQEKWPLKQEVCILLECILGFNYNGLICPTMLKSSSSMILTKNSSYF